MTVETRVQTSVYIFIYSDYKYTKCSISLAFQFCVFLNPEKTALETFSSFPSFLCNKHSCDLSGSFSKPLCLSCFQLVGPLLAPSLRDLCSCGGLSTKAALPQIWSGPPSDLRLQPPFSWGPPCSAIGSLCKQESAHRVRLRVLAGLDQERGAEETQLPLDRGPADEGNV